MQPLDRGSVRQFSIKRVSKSRSTRVQDVVAAEAPLQITVGYHFKGRRIVANLVMTMRTPGNDRELTAGFLLTEGIISKQEQILDIRPLGAGSSDEIFAELSPEVDFEQWKAARVTVANSSCGVCGKHTRDALRELIPAPSVSPDQFRFSAAQIRNLPVSLKAHQEGFAETGCLHAAALVSSSGQIQSAFEDIGRHNALDKLIGSCVLTGQIPLNDHLIFMSSRGSFELVQKTAMAGACALATVGGPSSLAIEAARECGITLIGFVRDDRFNLYSGDWRLDL